MRKKEKWNKSFHSDTKNNPSPSFFSFPLPDPGRSMISFSKGGNSFALNYSVRENKWVPEGT